MLAACSASSSGPKGWQPVPGASGAWTTGSGPTSQTYNVEKQSFGGALPDLASQVTIDVLMRNHGARLRGSVPFAPCPGAAGLATFQLAHTLLQEGFAVRNGQSIRVTYLRPVRAPADPAVSPAMQNVLCAL